LVPIFTFVYMKFQNQDVVEVKCGPSSALFAPQHGGRLLKWELDGEQIIYWPEQADWTTPRKIRGGNPLLFPFLARHVVDGQIGFWIDDTGIKREMPVHGFAHSLPFSYEIIEEGTAIRMVLNDSASTWPAYPYEFRFEAIYRLSGTSLEVTLVVCNGGHRPMPHYAGHHFYFSMPHEMRNSTALYLPANERQTYRSDGTLSAADAGQSIYQLSDERLQDHFHILKSQEDIRMVAPTLGREITLSLGKVAGGIPWYAIGTWTEKPDADSYCVEPWLGLPNAIHHKQGLRWLAPGQQEKAVCRIDVKFS